MPIGRLIIFLQMLALACADTTGTVAYKSDTCSGYGGDCDITCAKGGYEIKASDSLATIIPLDPSPGDCLCYTIRATVSGSELVYNNRPWTARVSGTDIVVNIEGVCMLTYTVSSGEVLGVTARSSAAPPRSPLLPLKATAIMILVLVFWEFM